MTENRFASMLRQELAELAPYVPQAGDFPVRLDANEAPPLLTDEARAKLAHALATTRWERYPDVRATELREAIASRMKVDPESLLIGCGSDEVIALLLTALDRPRTKAAAASIVTLSPTFVMYRISARSRGISVVDVPLDAEWDLDEEATLRAIETARPNVVFVATPNNPTGNAMNRGRLERIIERAADSLVVVDEAYVDYAGSSNLDLLRRPNVAVLRTVSKIGFAAARVGWLSGPVELVREIDKVRQPYNLSVIAQRVATVVLRDLADEVARNVANVVRARDALTAAIGKMSGFSVTPSAANFLWVKTPVDAGPLQARMAERGVLVKSFHQRGGRLTTQLRVTVGTADENAKLLEVLAACV
jgi:histidinol-phosphate aminotransferase